MKIKKPKFLKRDSKRYSKLGKKRKSKQSWRKPRGRDNKMREKRRGYPAVVSIGYKKPENKIKVSLVNNLKEIQEIKKGEEIIIGKVGKKKKIELIEFALKKGLVIKNLSVRKYLKKNKKEKKEDKK